MALERIALKDLIRTGQKELTLHEEYHYDELPVKGPVRVDAHIQLSATGLTIRGQYAAVVEEPCDRCAEPYERTIGSRFDERYVYEALTESPTAGEIELREDDFYDTIGPEGIFDVKDLIYQHIILALSTDRICGRDTCELTA